MFLMMYPMNKLRKELSMCDLPPTLYSIMESIVNYDRDDKVKIKDLASYSRGVIFDFNYPLSVNINKAEFETLFLKHYMFRRINYDTVLAFKLHLEVKLNEIMPKYNKMLEGFNNLDFLGDTEVHTRTQVDSKTTNTTSSNNLSNNTLDDTTSKTKYSDTPQDHLEDITDGSYISEYTEVANTGTSSSTSTSSGTNNSTDNGNLTENITIHRADSIDEYKKYLEVMSSIYEMIFKECDVLFYGLV